jgi:hypothetical protein
MGVLWKRAGAAVATAAVAAVVLGAGAAAAGSARSCGKPGYGYAGFQSVHRGHGVRATLRPLSTPAVENGHVAAWVGLGGPSQGPSGTDSWIQVGLSAFPWERTNKLYYEVKRPGVGPTYHEVLAEVAPGTRHRVAVLETRRRDWWRVWVDSRPVSPPIHLRQSSGRWFPIATAETWDGGRSSCNRFEYGFEALAVAGAPGGSWRVFVSGHRFEDPGHRVVAGRNGFLARTTLPPADR